MENNLLNQSQIFLLKSEENECLIESVMKLHNEYASGDMLFFTHKESSFIEDSFENLKFNMDGFDEIYKTIRFMFLKDSWNQLDEMYGKTFFINEMQKIIKKENFASLYFHRADIYFEGCSEKDIERIVSDIIEVANYYHKKLFFSLSGQTNLGQIINEVLYRKVDLEFVAKKDIDGKCYTKMQRYKKENSDVILFSDKDEVINFHKYIFKKDTFINFQHVDKLDQESIKLVQKADILIYNLQDILLKDKLLNIIRDDNLRTIFLFISEEAVIRKRDKIKNGISYIFEKHFNLLFYIHAIEKSLGRDFYTSIFKNIDLVPNKTYYSNQDKFKEIIGTFLEQQVYFSIVVIEYEGEKSIKPKLIENCVRELDIVYHNEIGKSLVFLLVDMLPSQALSLICKRLKNQYVRLSLQYTYDAEKFKFIMGEDLSFFSEEELKTI